MAQVLSPLKIFTRLQPLLVHFKQLYSFNGFCQLWSVLARSGKTTMSELLFGNAPTLQKTQVLNLGHAGQRKTL